MLLQILIIGHLIGDFFLQPAKLAEKKSNSIKFLLLHSLIYLSIFAILSFLFINWLYALISFLIISVSHFLIDWLRMHLDRKISNEKFHFFSFVFDQLLHLSIITITNYVFSLSNRTNSVFKQILCCINTQNIILYILLIAIILTPTAVFIKKLFLCLFGKAEASLQETDTSESSANVSTINVGNLIGQLERVIISVLLLVGQYGVVGLVLTAKSIARFKQLENKDFAEKYLVGTLFSILIAIVSTLIIKSLLI